ncbi:hypothetical protein BHE74_00046142 [Ensete ventricosum]|nr:hypothetical protein GW17_00037680 [Ensete ventricosum]RWW47835.1 hypothetical protein BHE74_00046142 [Ensete ventricosum]
MESDKEMGYTLRLSEFGIPESDKVVDLIENTRVRQVIYNHTVYEEPHTSTYTYTYSLRIQVSFIIFYRASCYKFPGEVEAARGSKRWRPAAVLFDAKGSDATPCSPMKTTPKAPADTTIL